MSLVVAHNVSLRPYNTLQIDAIANEWVVLDHLEQCAALPELVRNKKSLVLGGGSNLIFAADFEGLVIHNRLRGIELIRQDDEHLWISAAGGEIWDDLVAYSLTQGGYGLENLSAIPGTVGAAPVQNIGAYGVEIKDVLESVTFMQLADGSFHTLSCEQCRFAYRDSIFKQELQGQVIIVQVCLRLSRKPAMKLDYGEIRTAMAAANLAEADLTPARLRELIIEIRSRKLPDPKELPNVGSFFKNPLITPEQLAQLQQRWPELVSYPVGDGRVKIAAGWLLDRLGWKGRQWGNACVHDRQALVLINQGADGKDLLALKNAMQADVREQAGIELDVEPLIVGI